MENKKPPTAETDGGRPTSIPYLTMAHCKVVTHARHVVYISFVTFDDVCHNVSVFN